MVLRPLTLIGIIVSIVTGTALGVVAHLYTRDHNPSDPSATLSEALRQVSTNYVEAISEEELLGYAIEGMMRGLDDHSGYLNPSAFHALEAATKGEFGGIGIEIGLVDGYFTVIAPMDDTPAQRAGLEAGDQIAEIDGESLKGRNMMEVVDRLKGEPGSGLSLGVRREGDEDLLTFDLVRDTIEVASVRGRLLEPGFGYIRISQFQDATSRDLEALLGELNAQAPLRGLVLDLRNNPGGTLQASVEVADQFLQPSSKLKDLIVRTEGRLKSSHAQYRVTRGDLVEGAPIVVLINAGSASASEIVAGALQDHGRAKLMGSTSYGKGSVQSVLPLDDSQALKLTTAYYYTPNGRSIHEKGIDPDIAFDGEEEALLDEAVKLLKSQQSDTLQARLTQH
jgi:carboxyl-terminal processing protease